MSLCSSLSLSSPKSFSFLPKTKPLSFNGVSGSPVTYRFRASADVPDFLFADCLLDLILLKGPPILGPSLIWDSLNSLGGFSFNWNIEKLQKVVEEEGNYYGAQQMYNSISARYVSAQWYSEALDILQYGSCIQLKHGQITCGAELALLFVETLFKGNFLTTVMPLIPLPQHLPDDDEMEHISEALGAAKIRVDGCSSFLKAALKWSVESGVHRSGSPELHVMLAEYIYSESNEVLSWKRLPNREGENYLALIGPFPDLISWSAIVPDPLRTAVKQWKPCGTFS